MSRVKTNKTSGLKASAKILSAGVYRVAAGNLAALKLISLTHKLPESSILNYMAYGYIVPGV